ncbi:hypothetical protein QG37_04092 [Candidozyma auris]|nr:hypothetical protein QG37_04092 [[Candida] auris]
MSNGEVTSIRVRIVIRRGGFPGGMISGKTKQKKKKKKKKVSAYFDMKSCIFTGIE